MVTSPPSGHGFGRVEQEIEQDLLNLSLVRIDDQRNSRRVIVHVYL